MQVMCGFLITHPWIHNDARAGVREEREKHFDPDALLTLGRMGLEVIRGWYTNVRGVLVEYSSP